MTRAALIAIGSLALLLSSCDQSSGRQGGRQPLNEGRLRVKSGVRGNVCRTSAR